MIPAHDLWKFCCIIQVIKVRNLSWTVMNKFRRCSCHCVLRSVSKWFLTRVGPLEFLPDFIRNRIFICHFWPKEVLQCFILGTTDLTPELIVQLLMLFLGWSWIMPNLRGIAELVDRALRSIIMMNTCLVGINLWMTCFKGILIFNFHLDKIVLVLSRWRECHVIFRTPELFLQCHHSRVRADKSLISTNGQFSSLKLLLWSISYSNSFPELDCRRSQLQLFLSGLWNMTVHINSWVLTAQFIS